MITALEIFTNPSDLEIVIGQKQGDAKFAFSISRGPGHNFKPLLTSGAFADTSADAVTAVEQILQTVHQAVAEEVMNSASLVSQYVNPDTQEIDQSKILNIGLITRIIEELRVHGKVSTYNVVALAT